MSFKRPGGAGEILVQVYMAGGAAGSVEQTIRGVATNGRETHIARVDPVGTISVRWIGTHQAIVSVQVKSGSLAYLKRFNQTVIIDHVDRWNGVLIVYEVCEVRVEATVCTGQDRDETAKGSSVAGGAGRKVTGRLRSGAAK